MAKTKKQQIKVTQIKSVSGRVQSHKDCIRGLGLRRMHHSVLVQDTPEIRGMLNKVSYLVSVEEV